MLFRSPILGEGWGGGFLFAPPQGQHLTQRGFSASWQMWYAPRGETNSPLIRRYAPPSPTRGEGKDKKRASTRAGLPHPELVEGRGKTIPWFDKLTMRIWGEASEQRPAGAPSPLVGEGWGGGKKKSPVLLQAKPGSIIIKSKKPIWLLDWRQPKH